MCDGKISQSRQQDWQANLTSKKSASPSSNKDDQAEWALEKNTKHSDNITACTKIQWLHFYTDLSVGSGRSQEGFFQTKWNYMCYNSLYKNIQQSSPFPINNFKSSKLKQVNILHTYICHLHKTELLIYTLTLEMDFPFDFLGNNYAELLEFQNTEFTNYKW